MIKKAFREYANFLTRSTRWEFFSYLIYQFVVSVICIAILGIVSVMYYRAGVILPHMLSYEHSKEILVSTPIFVLIVILGCVLSVINMPWYALAVRRLHDAGFNAWWLLLNILPGFGWIAFIIIAALPAQPGNNQWGPNPRIAYRPVDQINMCMYYYKKAWRNYFDFFGKSDLCEFFGFTFIFYITVALIFFIFLIIGLILQLFMDIIPVWNLMTILSGLVLLIYSISLIIPSLSLCVRRLREAGYSPWFVLLLFLHNVGYIALYALCCQPKKNEEAQEYYDWSNAPQ